MKRDKQKIIVRVDGGICAQVAFVSMGLYLQEKFAGQAVVKYDLSWYREYGKDLTGKFPRNWDAPKAFPGLELPEATEDECNYFSRHYNKCDSEIEGFGYPLYIGGYPNRYPTMCRMAPKLIERFHPNLNESTKRHLEFIAAGLTCAIHVRRGDLAVYNPAYGQPATIDYFTKAVKIIRGLEPNVRFLLFSDEPDWVRNELVPALPKGSEYVVAEGNGSDGGYLDLFLISKCDYIISSSGSLGVFGAVLSQKCRMLVMNRNRTFAFKHLKNVLYLNDSYTEEPKPPSKSGGFLSRLCAKLGA